MVGEAASTSSTVSSVALPQPSRARVPTEPLSLLTCLATRLVRLPFTLTYENKRSEKAVSSAFLLFLLGGFVVTLFLTAGISFLLGVLLDTLSRISLFYNFWQISLRHFNLSTTRIS